MKLLWGSWNGMLVGALLLCIGYFWGSGSRATDSEAQQRARELEEELERMRDREERYRASVAEHFGRTSDIFRSLTGEYRSLYTHLADGARALASDRIPALRFDQPGLLRSGSDAANDVDGEPTRNEAPEDVGAAAAKHAPQHRRA